MYAIRKPKSSSDDVFIGFPTKMMSLPLKENIQWLVDHKIEFGYLDGRVVGVYVSNIDAMTFKLKFSK